MSTIAERLSEVDSKLNNILANANTQLTNKGKTAVSDLSDLPSAMGKLKNPTGTISITENGTVDVSQYASANVNVQGSSSTNNATILPKTDAYFNIYQFIGSIDDNIDISQSTMLRSFFSSLTQLKKAPMMDTKNIVDAQNLFSGCKALETVPLYDFSNLTLHRNYNMFNNCQSLSNESLNNILQMCIGMTGVDNKNLKYMGISSTQADTCQTLSNWDDFVAAGWTTGY